MVSCTIRLETTIQCNLQLCIVFRAVIVNAHWVEWNKWLIKCYHCTFRAQRALLYITSLSSISPLMGNWIIILEHIHIFVFSIGGEACFGHFTKTNWNCYFSIDFPWYPKQASQVVNRSWKHSFHLLKFLLKQLCIHNLIKDHLKKDIHNIHKDLS